MRTVPHVCGDEPQLYNEKVAQIACSPRVWG